MKRLSKLTKEFNVGLNTIVEALKENGIEIEANPNTKVDDDAIALLDKLFGQYKKQKEKAEEKSQEIHTSTRLKSIELDESSEATHLSKEPSSENNGDELRIKDNTAIDEPSVSEILKDEKTQPKDTENTKLKGPKILGTIDLDAGKKKPKKKESETKKSTPKSDDLPKKETPKKEVSKTIKSPKIEKPDTLGKIDSSKKKTETPKTNDKTEKTTPPPTETKKEEPSKKTEIEHIETKVETLSGPHVVGKIDLPAGTVAGGKKKAKKKEKVKQLVATSNVQKSTPGKSKRPRIRKEANKPHRNKKAAPKEVNEEDVQKQIKETLARLQHKEKSKSVKHRRDKRETVRQKTIDEQEKQEQENKILKVTEFISVGELSSLMEVPSTQIITTCMSLGLFVSINQRLDADTISLLAEEYGFSVKFTTVEEEKEIEIHDDEADLKPRAPIVTIMGHVDHGKTKLLDYIRQSNVISGEAGGITQHIGAYRVKVGDDDNEITFLDTPGHEAFTAMRARGAQVTDIAIIIVAADDGIMPQTKEAISHAQAAGVPMVFAINKIDKPTANADRIREQLANMNILVEAWGGKYQCQEISAKTGQGVPELLEKILLEAELLELKANPDTLASGVVIEATLEKGKGYVTTLLVQRGTLKMKDIAIAGTVFGHIRAMYNEYGEKINEVGPSMPVIVLGLNGAPQAGDTFKVAQSDSEAKEIATKREQLLREQTMRTKKHITLDEVSRRLKLGNFKELNFIIKADVDGSIEALADAIIKLSNEEISINVIHKAVGQISESDVMLATASDAVIIGFQVRPSLSARKLAEKEQVDIRLYSVIYDAINEIKDAMEGMLSPEIKETIIGSAEVLNIFKISKFGKVLGCRVVEGKITRDSNVRLIRDGIVIFTGKLSSLKRYKDDAKEVNMGMECGLSIENFSDAKVDDVVEAYIETEVKRTL